MSCDDVIDEFLKVVLQCKSNKKVIQIREPILNIYECKNTDKFIYNMNLGKVKVDFNTQILKNDEEYSIEYNLDKRLFTLDKK